MKNTSASGNRGSRGDGGHYVGKLPRIALSWRGTSWRKVAQGVTLAGREAGSSNLKGMWGSKSDPVTEVSVQCQL